MAETKKLTIVKIMGWTDALDILLFTNPPTIDDIIKHSTLKEEVIRKKNSVGAIHWELIDLIQNGE